MQHTIETVEHIFVMILSKHAHFLCNYIFAVTKKFVPTWNQNAQISFGMIYLQCRKLSKFTNAAIRHQSATFPTLFLQNKILCVAFNMWRLKLRCRKMAHQIDDNKTECLLFSNIQMRHWRLVYPMLTAPYKGRFLQFEAIWFLLTVDKSNQIKQSILFLLHVFHLSCSSKLAQLNFMSFGIMKANLNQQ